jgi:hypothetical protein
MQRPALWHRQQLYWSKTRASLSTGITMPVMITPCLAVHIAVYTAAYTYCCFTCAHQGLGGTPLFFWEVLSC